MRSEVVKASDLLSGDQTSDDLQGVEVGDLPGRPGAVGGDDVDLLAPALVGDEGDRLAVGRIEHVLVAGGAFGELAELAVLVGRRGEQLAVDAKDDPLAVGGEVVVVDRRVEVAELGQASPGSRRRSRAGSA